MELEIKQHLREALLAAKQSVAVEACESDAYDMLVFSQDAFGYSMQDLLTLGTLVKYAGIHGKKVVIPLHDLKPEPEESGDV